MCHVVSVMHAHYTRTYIQLTNLIECEQKPRHKSKRGLCIKLFVCAFIYVCASVCLCVFNGCVCEIQINGRTLLFILRIVIFISKH